MKKTKNLIGFTLRIFFAGVMLLTVASCTKNEVPYEDCSGILTYRFQLPDGRVFDCSVDQANLVISNSLDSILYGTTSTTLSKLKPVFTTTIGAKVFVNNVEIKSGVTEIDFTKAVKIHTEYNNVTRDYTVNAFVEKKDHSEVSGAKINTDMRLTGLPSFNSYSAAYFLNKLYILGAYYPNGTLATGTAYYELYSSTDGGLWTKVTTTPNVIGGFGAVLTVLGDKLYAIGGARLYGKDVNATAPESSITWRIMSTTNGTDWTDCTVGQVGNPTGRAFSEVCVHNGKIVLRRGKSLSFGSWQNVNQTNTFQTSDGINWTSVTATPSTSTNRSEDAMFSFNGKLWIVSGFANYISAANMRNDIWSSADNGLTWVQETAASGPANLMRYAHNVVTYNGKLYMIGGEMLDASSNRVGITDVLTSTNAINWTSLPTAQQLPSAFTSRVVSNVFMGKDDLIWIIGGFNNSLGNYTINGLTMVTKFDVWIKKLK